MPIFEMVMLGMVCGYVLYWSWVRRSYPWSVVGMAGLIAPAITANSDGVAPFVQIGVASVVVVVGMFVPTLFGRNPSRIEADAVGHIAETD